MYAALVLASASMACHDDDPVRPVESLRVQVPSGTVQAVIQSVPGGRNGEVTLIVRVVSNGVPVGAYQGSVTFAPGAFTLVYASSAGASDDAAHVLNTSTFAEGRIRFAAFTATRFAEAETEDGTEAFRFTVKPLQPVAAADLTVTLETVGESTGTAVAADRVLASPGVHDRSGRLITK